jgi:Domain of unknown function (DUF4281)
VCGYHSHRIALLVLAGISLLCGLDDAVLSAVCCVSSIMPRWIYLDGLEKGVFMGHSLSLCLMFGPIGLLSHLTTCHFFTAWKSRRSRQPAT